VKETVKLFRALKAQAHASVRRRLGVAQDLRCYLETHPIWDKVFQPALLGLEGVITTAMSLDVQHAPGGAGGLGLPAGV
jgi:hypothetical protein